MRVKKLGMVVAALSVILCFGQWVQAATRITMGGGAPGGTYYSVMAAMAKVLEAIFDIICATDSW